MFARVSVSNNDFWGLLQAGSFVPNVVVSLIAISLIWLATLFLRKLINRSVTDPSKKYAFRKILTIFSLFMSAAVVAFFLLGSPGGLAALVGLIGAGMAVALQDVLKSLFCWPLIIGNKGFKTGDRIQSGDMVGDVIDIGILRTTLLEVGNWSGGEQSTGRIVHVANKFILDAPLLNYTHGFEVIWHEISILITFESDWREAEKILYDAAMPLPEGMERKLERDFTSLQEKYLFRRGATTPFVYISIEDSGVKLTLRFLVETRKRRTVHDTVCRQVLEGIEKSEKVALAYPTIRVYKRGEGALSL